VQGILRCQEENLLNTLHAFEEWRDTHLFAERLDLLNDRYPRDETKEWLDTDDVPSGNQNPPDKISIDLSKWV
jgi:hypothetical protein